MKLPTVAELERRAKRIGLTKTSLCERAGVAISTFYRWRNGENRPLVPDFEKLTSALEAAEAQFEHLANLCRENAADGKTAV